MNEDLLRFISLIRLEKYKLGSENLAQALIRYQWNIQLAEAFMPALNYVEIGLRNSLNDVISKLYSDDWLINIPKKLQLSDDDIEKITETKEKIEEDKNRAATHADVLAALNLGFWVSFFHKRLGPGLWHRGQNTLGQVFPNISPGRLGIKVIHDKLVDIKELRNRIAHHEPIWQSPKLLTIHGLCYEVVDGMSKTAPQHLAEIDRFTTVYNEGLAKGLTMPDNSNNVVALNTAKNQ